MLLAAGTRAVVRVEVVLRRGSLLPHRAAILPESEFLYIMALSRNIVKGLLGNVPTLHPLRVQDRRAL